MKLVQAIGEDRHDLAGAELAMPRQTFVAGDLVPPPLGGGRLAMPAGAMPLDVTPPKPVLAIEDIETIWLEM